MLLSCISKIPHVTALKRLAAVASSSCWSISVPLSGCSNKVPRAAGFLLVQRHEEQLMLGIACGGEGCSPAACDLQWWLSLACPPTFTSVVFAPQHRIRSCCPRPVFLSSNGGGQIWWP